MTLEKLKELFKETSFIKYPVHVQCVPGKDNDTLQDDYPEALMFYKGATKSFADWGDLDNAIFVRAAIEYFSNLE